MAGPTLLWNTSPSPSRHGRHFTVTVRPRQATVAGRGWAVPDDPIGEARTCRARQGASIPAQSGLLTLAPLAENQRPRGYPIASGPGGPGVRSNRTDSRPASRAAAPRALAASLQPSLSSPTFPRGPSLPGRCARPPSQRPPRRLREPTPRSVSIPVEACIERPASREAECKGARHWPAVTCVEL